jgi:hypothetical protein
VLRLAVRRRGGVFARLLDAVKFRIIPLAHPIHLDYIFGHRITRRDQMTRKDYELIAGVFAHRINGLEARDNGATATAASLFTAKELADAMALQLKQDNPRFDRERFLKACGV